ncbi:MAG: hypothetical protein IT370_23275 [Deltaproteobacteria bacterium]|nr:hypothetical protein [Deltaproteobacteria bacterium]
MQRDLDVHCTVLVPFADDEDFLGPRIRQVASHLKGLGVSFEILAIDEGSGDNSLFVLTLAHREIAELSLVGGAAPGRGFARGAELARGSVLILIDPRVEAPLAPVAIAMRRIEDGADAVVFPGRMVIARRARTWQILSKLRGRLPGLDAQMSRKARRAGLHIEAPKAAGGFGREERAALHRLAARGPRAVFAMFAGVFSR